MELTDGCYSEGDSQGLQCLFTPVSLGYPLSVFNKNSTLKTTIDQFVLACTLSMFAIHLRIRHRNLTRATSNPVDPTANSKRHFLLSARV